LNDHYELFGVPIWAKRMCPRQWANPKLFEALEPSFERYASLRVRFSEQAHAWVKKLIRMSEKEFFKGLELTLFEGVTPDNRKRISGYS